MGQRRCFSFGLCLGLGDFQLSQPLLLPSFSLGIKARGLSRQSSLFGIPTLLLRQRGQARLFACADFFLLPAHRFGNVTLAQIQFQRWRLWHIHVLLNVRFHSLEKCARVAMTSVSPANG